MLKYNILYLHGTSQLSGAENSLIGLAQNIDRLKFNPIFIHSRPENLALQGKDEKWPLEYQS